jgi:transcriptional regulator with XRE-family HTH domain
VNYRDAADDQSRARVKLARTYLGWTQQDLAVRSGLTLWYVGAFERGHRSLTLGEKQAIARALSYAIGTPVEAYFPELAQNRPTDGAASTPAGNGPGRDV